MKNFIALFLSLTLSLPQFSYAGSCTADRSKASDECGDEKYAPIKKEVDAAAAACGASCTSDLSGVLNDAQRRYVSAIQKNHQYKEKCGETRQSCVDSCTADTASPDPGTRQTGESGKDYCENGEPKKNEEASDQNNAAMMQALAGLLAAMMQRGQQPTPEATQTVCNSATNTTTTTGTTSSTSGVSPQTMAMVCPGIDKSTTSDSAFADGSARTADGALYEGDSGLASGSPAAGTPAQVQLSSAIPGNAGGGLGAGAAAGGGGSGGRDSGKKAGNGEEGNKLGANPTGGGGGSGGGSLAGTGKSASSGPGGPATRTPVDGLEKGMQAAIEKAAQQRGIASEGPLGGITGANSLDNFQKVEKRIQSERNNLNEL